MTAKWVTVPVANVYQGGDLRWEDDNAPRPPDGTKLYAAAPTPEPRPDVAGLVERFPPLPPHDKPCPLEFVEWALAALAALKEGVK